MKRREFIAGLGAAGASRLAAQAQQPSIPMIGWLHVGMRDESVLAAFRKGLRETGFVEGQNVAIEQRWAENQIDRLPVLAVDFVQRRMAVIAVAPNPVGIAPVKAATSVIPIVFMCGPDPVRTGLVASLSRPGGNLTGVTLLGEDLNAKRFALLHNLAPQLATIALLEDVAQKTGTDRDYVAKQAESAARNLGVRIVSVRVATADEFEAAFASAAREGAAALIVSPSVLFIDHRDRLMALASKYQMPAMYQDRVYPANGGLMSYGPSLADAYRQTGVYTGRVLKGEKPADLPVLQPTTFEFVINLKTAKALDLAIPPGVLAIADEVIE
jgi:putative ABC transport system substrate-binding protein